MAQVPRACNIEKEEVDIRKALTKVMPLHGILLRQQVGVDPNDVNAPQYGVWADMIDIKTFQAFLKGEDAIKKNNTFLKGEVTKLKKQIESNNG